MMQTIAGVVAILLAWGVVVLVVCCCILAGWYDIRRGRW